MMLGVGEKRRAVAARSLSILLVAITVGLGSVAAVYFSQVSSPAALSSSSPGSSSSVLSSSGSSSSSSSVLSAAQAAAPPYLLVWGPKPPTVCGDGGFCIAGALGMAGQTVTSNTTESVTTIIQGNVTTIISGSITTINSSGNAEVIDVVNDTGTTTVDVIAWVQDALTGQNATSPGGNGPFAGSSCNIRPTGFTQCGASAPYALSVPSGDPYKVTLFVTARYTPCSLTHGPPCASQLLAPPITVIIPASAGI